MTCFSAATADEQHFLVRLLSGELRQGALDGVMTEAVARAAGVPVAQVRRAVMLRGSLPAVAGAALSGGTEALSGFGLRVGQPLKPMLAASAPTIEDALAKIAAGAGRRADERLTRTRPLSGSSTASGFRRTSSTATCGCTPGR